MFFKRCALDWSSSFKAAVFTFDRSLQLARRRARGRGIGGAWLEAELVCEQGLRLRLVCIGLDGRLERFGVCVLRHGGSA